MTDRPNLVLVTVDSLRADYCSFMGNSASGTSTSNPPRQLTPPTRTTPTLDTLATEGAAFVRATAPGPSTPESMPAVFTGRDPIDPVDPTDIAEARSYIRRHMVTRDTLPERLSRRGYATAGFTPNPYTSRYFGFDVGFDQFKDFADASVRTAGDGLLQRLSPTSDAAQAARMLLNLVQREEVFKPWEAYVDAIEAWIRGAARPYFVWVHVMDPHVPYMAPAAYRRLSWIKTFRANVAFWRGDKEAGLDAETLERLRTAYADSVRYADAFLERLQTTTDGDALLVVHADHGEAFGEHGTYGHEPYLYEENIHVPLVVGGVPSAIVDQPVSLRELPTLVTRLADRNWNSAPTGGSFAVSRAAGGERVALRGRRLKYIQSPTGQELYDLAHGEHEPLTDEPLRAACREALRGFEADEAEAKAIRTAVERLREVRV